MTELANPGRSGSKTDDRVHGGNPGLYYRMNSRNINCRERPIQATLHHLVWGQAVLQHVTMM